MDGPRIHSPSPHHPVTDTWQVYRPMLARVASHDELLDMLDEMLGELGASHAYMSPPDGDDGDDDGDGRQGSLGVNVEWDVNHSAWRIVHIVRGDASDDRAASPLSRPAVGAAVGDYLIAVNQIRLSLAMPPEMALRRLAGREHMTPPSIPSLGGTWHALPLVTRGMPSAW